MSEQEIRQLAERLIREVWSVDGNLDAADELLADDYVIHGQPEGVPWPATREGEKQQAPLSAASRAVLQMRRLPTVTASNESQTGISHQSAPR